MRALRIKIRDSGIGIGFPGYLGVDCLLIAGAADKIKGQNRRTRRREQVSLGQRIFSHNWVADDRNCRGGDGLGPGLHRLFVRELPRPGRPGRRRVCAEKRGHLDGLRHCDRVAQSGCAWLDRPPVWPIDRGERGHPSGVRWRGERGVAPVEHVAGLRNLAQASDVTRRKPRGGDRTAIGTSL